MCLPEQGTTMDFKSSSDQAGGTGFVCENQEKVSSGKLSFSYLQHLGEKSTKLMNSSTG